MFTGIFYYIDLHVIPRDFLKILVLVNIFLAIRALFCIYGSRSDLFIYREEPSF